MVVSRVLTRSSYSGNGKAEEDAGVPQSRNAQKAALTVEMEGEGGLEGVCHLQLRRRKVISLRRDRVQKRRQWRRKRTRV